MSSGKLTFLSYARSGLAQFTGPPATTASALRGTIKLKVEVEGGGSEEVGVSPYGPGDVTGIDIRQVIRTEPRPDTDNFAPNLFPFIEFDRPDFPWMFTPLAPSGGKLNPWLVLVVVRDGSGNELTDEPEVHPLPKLMVAKANDDLPNLADAWAWAHVQVTGGLGQTLAATDAANPERTLSRLLCPRRLRPATRYLACLVPAYRAGAEAGLGKAVTSVFDLAWAQGTDPVELPVYHHWRFGTGPEGDFESLARLLEPRAATGVGERPMDASGPGSGLPSAGMQALEGALRAPVRARRRLPSAFMNAVEGLIDADLPMPGSGTEAHVLTPPFYGRWPSGRDSVASAPAWLRDLNLNPRHRAAAAIGAEVVRDQQESLMAAAWAQAGELLAANELMRRAQLARAGTESALGRRVEPLDDGAFFSVVAPALGRIRTTTGSQQETLLAKVRRHALPQRALSAPFRRVVRAGGPLSRRAGGAAATQVGGLITELNATASPLAPARALPDGAQTHPPGPSLDPGLRHAPDPSFNVRGATGDEGGDIPRFQQGCIELLDAVSQLEAHPDPTPTPLDLQAARQIAESALDAEKTVPARVLERLSNLDPGWTPGDELEPIMASPSFAAPMFDPLRRRSQELVAPGIGSVPPNTVTVLETNNRFVNSYMIGLNHEMARELLWRGFPTDQRGTYFRQFWDPRTRVPPPAQTTVPDPRDLPALHEWPASRPLGHGQGAAAGGRIVLVLRGELLRRYPNATIYAGKAKTAAPPELDTEEKHPVFRGTLDPDVTLLGFDLTVADALGPPGWFFVLQEQPTEPAFGLEAERSGVFASNTTNLSDISWGELVANQTTLTALTHAPAAPPQAWPGPAQNAPAWGSNSADMAHITLQEPARVAIHAKHLLS
jgi:hypothetical protein